jgi:1,2-phenylacetyl-CoA epoxidase catalytic subunit
MHAEMWHERLRDAPQFREAVAELWPYALGMLPAGEQRDALVSRVGLALVDPVERGAHTEGLPEIWDEMTMVRRSAPLGSQW